MSHASHSKYEIAAVKIRHDKEAGEKEQLILKLRAHLFNTTTNSHLIMNLQS